jgi:polyisoprenoid-binding protein YceI
MKKVIIVTISMLFTVISVSSASTWKVDTDHSAANFSIKHMAISTVKGAFDKITGQLEFHESGPNPFSLELTIDPASIDTGVTKRDDHLRSADFFDVKKHPSITFISERVTLSGNGAYQVEGTLDMHGVSKQVTVFLEGLVAEEKDPWGNVRRGAQISGDIKRKDFGIVYNSVLESGNLLIGEIADVNIDLQFIKN